MRFTFRFLPSLMILAALPCIASNCSHKCCQIGDGYFWLSSSDCSDASGSVMDKTSCEEQVVCCNVGDSTYQTTSTTCERLRGAASEMDDCDEVCCDYPQGASSVEELDNCLENEGLPTTGPACEEPAETGGDTGPDDKGKDVCCYIDPLVLSMSSDECSKRGGRSFQDSSFCGTGGMCKPPSAGLTSDGVRTWASVRLDPKTCDCSTVAPGSYDDLMYFALEGDHVFASKGVGYSIDSTNPPDIVSFGMDISEVPLNTPVTILFSGDMYGIWARLEFVATLSGISDVSVYCW